MPRPPTILLTGATGQVGGSVLGELIEAGCRVICLARGRPGRPAEARIRDTLARVGRDPAADFSVIEGELTRGDLGLAPADRARLTAAIDRIIHCGARVEFDVAGHNEPFDTNVGGTEAMLALAFDAGAVPFTQVSTAYVCGDLTGTVPEAVTATAPIFRNPYEASKWHAEQRVVAAGRRGLPVSIARPSIIVGGAVDGRAVHFQGFYLVCRAVSMLCQLAGHDRFGAEALTLDDLDLPGDLDGPINLVTADYVGAAVARIGLLDRAIGGVYHLTHPAPPTLGELCDALSGYYRLHLPRVDARRARPRLTARAGPRLDPPRLRPRLARMSQQFWRYSRAVRPYFAETPLFETAATRALLEPLGVRPAPVDRRLLERVLDYAERVAFGRDLPHAP